MTDGNQREKPKRKQTGDLYNPVNMAGRKAGSVRGYEKQKAKENADRDCAEGDK
jgi:hypothetical protein